MTQFARDAPRFIAQVRTTQPIDAPERLCYRHPTRAPLTVTAVDPSDNALNASEATVKTNGTAGVGNKPITIQRSLNNATWTTVGTATTNATTGWYQFKRNETGTGLYYYRALFPGDTAYLNATSNIVKVTITKMPTALNATASTTTPSVNQTFTIKGRLTANGTGIANQTLALYRLDPVTDTFVKYRTVQTNNTGYYTFSSLKERTAGTYDYVVLYSGTAPYRSASAMRLVDVA